jgi:hypothetical protein
MHVFVGGRKIKLDPAASIGKGGEADVFDIGGGFALKLFKPPDHPDFEGDADAQEGARRRLDEHQKKLRAFPAALPARVIVPEALALHAPNGRVVGYTMRLLKGAEVLLRYGERSFRQGIGNEQALEVFRGLHATVGALHKAGVVIGDFNDLNVLVAGTEAHLIDADSLQFDRFLCPVFTERFVDPTLCDPSRGHLMLARPHTADSDWYAFTAMLMRSLLFVEPYGGVFRPKDPAQMVAPGARPLKRITVFHPEVRYPKPAERWDVLPDDLLQRFHAVFVKDERGEFPLAVLEATRWTRCDGCGREHARALCPYCAGAPPAAVREITRVRGEVTSRRVFVTAGTILEAACPDGTLQLLYQDGDVVRREDGVAVFGGRAAGRALRLRVRGRQTLVAQGPALVALDGAGAGTRWATDVVDGEAAFETNGRHVYRIHEGRLLREGPLGAERIGDVLAGQTRLWVGPEFGFGFYRAGQLQVGFVFDAERGGLNDGVALPRMAGQLTAARAVFGPGRCWLLTAAQANGRTVHRCTVMARDGRVMASAVGIAGDGTWLGHIGHACAAGSGLLVPTDDGIVRVEVDGASIVKTREFPDTEPFVDAESRLLAGSDGLYVVDAHEVRRLTLRAA